ncbi:MAG: hypothetical protein QOJ42_6132 [Acidobacteriaceae bacterium]|nr:hypothetical protein [Acidobacteriaceae bacterium]
MKTIKKANIATQDMAAEKRSVSLEPKEDGSIEMFTSDTGETALATWNKEDYDFWVTVPPEAISLLAFELLRERFAGRVEATDELRELCKAGNVAHEWQSYP